MPTVAADPLVPYMADPSVPSVADSSVPSVEVPSVPSVADPSIPSVADPLMPSVKSDQLGDIIVASAIQLQHWQKVVLLVETSFFSFMQQVHPF